MNHFFDTLRKGLRILFFRLRHQGIGTTLQWLYDRGLPALTGVPVMRYSKVTPQIYVGPQIRIPGKRALMNDGIHTSVNMRIEFDDRSKGFDLPSHCHLPTVDDLAPSMEQLFQGVNFIQREVGAGGKVYIHCTGGIGRAPTMAAAYLISQGDSLEQALERIRTVRPFINLSDEQRRQLDRFAEIMEKDLARKDDQPVHAGDAP
jgi:protein-tyrosine phosphatase